MLQKIFVDFDFRSGLCKLYTVTVHHEGVLYLHHEKTELRYHQCVKEIVQECKKFLY